ncbi:MAG TPA: hypothetical protein PLG47_06305 [Candidatus Dojkabacteria bacterium]|nr:hypothetical protein [Candidatus Dojkabacteria bacterium]
MKQNLEQCYIEIQDIIKCNDDITDRLQALKDEGYTVQECWTKQGMVGKCTYIPTKRHYRIQVADSEIRGKYPIAWTVVIPYIMLELTGKTLEEEIYTTIF